MIDIKTHQFIQAYFTNNERTIARAEWLNKKIDKIETEVIVCKNGEIEWDRLLTQISIDDLHESTYKYFKEQDNAFKDQVISIAKERGLIYDVDVINTDIYKALAVSLFAPFNPEEDKEKLFMCKLQLFEVEVIKQSSNRELKTKLRKSQTILEALKVAIEIVENTSDTTE